MLFCKLQVESEQLEVALRSSEDISSKLHVCPSHPAFPFSFCPPQGKSAEVFDAKDKSLEAEGERIKTEAAEVKKIMETIVGLSKVRCGSTHNPLIHERGVNMTIEHPDDE